jgi:hypothetical protein
VRCIGAGQLSANISAVLLADEQRKDGVVALSDGPDAGEDADGQAEEELGMPHSALSGQHALLDVGSVRRLLAMPASERSPKARYAALQAPLCPALPPVAKPPLGRFGAL